MTIQAPPVVTSSPTEALVSLPTAAKKTGLSARTLRRNVQEGVLRVAHRDGRALYFRVGDLRTSHLYTPWKLMRGFGVGRETGRRALRKLEREASVNSGDRPGYRRISWLMGRKLADAILTRNVSRYTLREMHRKDGLAAFQHHANPVRAIAEMSRRRGVEAMLTLTRRRTRPWSEQAYAKELDAARASVARRHEFDLRFVECLGRIMEIQEGDRHLRFGGVLREMIAFTRYAHAVIK